MNDERARPPRAVVDRRSRWGILSTALINTKVLAGARTSRLVEIVAVASRSAARAESYARLNAIARPYGSYEALLADPEIDVVYVSLPNALHHEWTVRALEAGKHVLCEKPYSRDPAEVETAFGLAAERGLVLSEAFMYRYNPQITQLVSLIEQGAIGELRCINASFTWPCDAPGDIRLSAELGGGSLVDVGCYCVNAARLLAGEPTHVTAQQVVGDSGVEVRFVGTLAFEAGVLAHFDSGFHLPDRSLLEVVGSDGTLRVRDPWHCLDPALEIQPQHGDGRRIPFSPTNSYTLELDSMHAAIAGGSSSLLGRADALGQARAIQALYAAAESGRAVSLVG